MVAKGSARQGEVSHEVRLTGDVGRKVDPESDSWSRDLSATSLPHSTALTTSAGSPVKTGSFAHRYSGTGFFSRDTSVVLKLCDSASLFVTGIFTAAEEASGSAQAKVSQSQHERHLMELALFLLSDLIASHSISQYLSSYHSISNIKSPIGNLLTNFHQPSYISFCQRHC